MCCDICPFFDECEELGKVKDSCCSECPDYDECIGEGFKKEEEEEES
jgi:hypothetical protein